MLKLDFCKAFDSVDWNALDVVLAMRGFGSRWQMWVQYLLSTSKITVLLNDVSGKVIPLARTASSSWQTCCTGLLSPRTAGSFTHSWTTSPAR